MVWRVLNYSFTGDTNQIIDYIRTKVAQRRRVLEKAISAQVFKKTDALHGN